MFFFLLTALRCFAHIVNLTCKEMLKEAAEGAHYDQVSKLRTVINYVSPFSIYIYLRLIFYKIRGSSLRRDLFSKISLELDPGRTPLQLIRDVETRWSSTFLMIRRAIQLKNVSYLEIQYILMLNSS